MCAQTKIQIEDILTCPVRALHSLTHGQADTVEAVLPAGWAGERHEGYDGHLTLMLAPEEGDEAGATLVVHRDEGGLRLDATRWDDWTSLGCGLDMPALLAAVQAALPA